MNGDHDIDRAVAMLLRASALKTAPRTGWALRGIAAPESVAAHAHGVALAALLLLELVDEPLDRARVLAMAILHDLPEAVTGDLSLGASALLPSGAKRVMEECALADLLGGLECVDSWRELWAEYEARRTPEANLVRDADRLDLLLQALAYEETTGNRRLGEFWQAGAREPFAQPASQRIAEALARRRPR
jgi:putative hydrolase of HD superfamily